MMDSYGQTVLIDFGISQKYSSEEKDADFKGNLMFASINQLEFKQPTRKDDLVSLAYMLISMVCSEEGTLPF